MDPALGSERHVDLSEDAAGWIEALRVFRARTT